ncbi:MAG: hypothetical protein LH610_01580 [Sphingomonas bacterium]|nr:hypothetical protein [Sphingomonas bacterium]
MDADKTLNEAIAVAAEDWPRFDATMPTNLHLRDKVTYFAQRMKPILVSQFPDLIAATEQVMLLVLVKGIEQSGGVPRRRIERDLGLLLPP